MDFSYTPEQEAFRVRVRDWLKKNSAEVFGQHYDKLPRSVAGVFDVGDDASWERLLEWHQRLYEAGYIALGWPQEWGGAGAGPVEQAIYQDEVLRLGLPLYGANRAFSYAPSGSRSWPGRVFTRPARIAVTRPTVRFDIVRRRDVHCPILRYSPTAYCHPRQSDNPAEEAASPLFAELARSCGTQYLSSKRSSSSSPLLAILKPRPDRCHSKPGMSATAAPAAP